MARFSGKAYLVTGAARGIEEAVARRLAFDGAVPCAGIACSARAEEMTDTQFADVLGINLNAVFYTCRAAGRANYAASKWGLIGLTKTLAVEWGHRGVRVNAVAPNGVDAPMIRDGLPTDFLEGVMLDRTPLGRLAKPEEIAAVIACLLSDEAAYVNGAVLEVDGGLTAGFMTHRHGADFGAKSIDNNPDRKLP